MTLPDPHFFLVKIFPSSSMGWHFLLWRPDSNPMTVVSTHPKAKIGLAKPKVKQRKPQSSQLTTSTKQKTNKQTNQPRIKTNKTHESKFPNNWPPEPFCHARHHWVHCKVSLHKSQVTSSRASQPEVKQPTQGTDGLSAGEELWMVMFGGVFWLLKAKNRMKEVHETKHLRFLTWGLFHFVSKTDLFC